MFENLPGYVKHFFRPNDRQTQGEQSERRKLFPIFALMIFNFGTGPDTVWPIR